MEITLPLVYTVRDVEIDPATSCVRRSGEAQYLRAKTFQVLMHLIANRERTVSKEELLQSIWQGTAVTDDTLVQSIGDIRKAVGDDPRDPWFIRTIPRTGYHLIAPLAAAGPGPAPSVAPLPSVPLPVLAESSESPLRVDSRRRFLYAALATMLLLAGGIAWWLRTSTRATPIPHMGGTSTLREEQGRDHMTDNLEAYEAYTRGVEAADHLENAAAIAHFERAIALDPQFAMAYARIGFTYTVRWSAHDRGKPYLARALEQGSRLSERERLYVLAWQAIADHQFGKAIDHYRLLVSRYPTDVEAYAGLARLLVGEERLEEAIDVIRRGLAFDPESRELNNTMGTAASYLGRHDEAIAYHKRYVAGAPEVPNAHDSLGLSYQWAGHARAALAEYGEALRLNPRFEIAVIHRANTYWQMGRIRDAIQEIHRYIEIAPSNAERGRGWGELSRVYSAIGDLERAASTLQEARRYDPDMSYFVLFAVAQRDAAATKQLVSSLPSPTHSNRGARYPARLQYVLRAQGAMLEGDATRAVEYAREAVRRQPLIYLLDDHEDTLGDTLAAAGRHAEAIDEYHRVLKLSSSRGRTRYKLARSLDAIGRTAEARSEYERFLEVWKDADPDAPEIVATKMRLGRK